MEEESLDLADLYDDENAYQEEPQQETQQHVDEYSEEIEQLTANDVQNIVDAANGVLVDDIASRDAVVIDEVRQVRDLLSTNGTNESDASDYYVVRVDASQVETAKGLGRLLATEGLLLIVLLGIAVGLMGWQAMRENWVR